jgi:hypothetical protein
VCQPSPAVAVPADCPDGAPVSDGRFCETAFLLIRHARRALPTGLGPENIALPLGHLVESRQLALPAIATDVPLPGVITMSRLLDGAATFADVSQKAREFADWLLALADSGYRLQGPFLDNCAVYGMRGPAGPTSTPDSGSPPGPV